MKKEHKIKKIIGTLFLAVLFCGAFVPASTVHAASPAKCFNQLAGTVYLCKGITSKTQDGAAVEDGKCYIYTSAKKGWEVSDCSLSQFSNISSNYLSAVPIATDPSACGKSIKKCCDVNTINNSNKASDCGFIKRINDFIAFLSVIVGVACAIGIIIGGIEYSMSGGDPKRTASGKDHITKAVIAVVMFGFLYTFLQFIVPGGFLNG